TQLHSALDPKSQTLATVFSKAGYRTAAFGKMHWPRKVVGDATFGFDRVLGRKDWESALSSQDKVSYDEYRALWQHESREGWSTLNPARQPCPLAEDRQLAPWLIEHALTHLGSDSERPSLTFLSFYEPHAPFCFPERLKDAVDPATLDWDAWDRERRARDAPGLERWWRDRLRERGPFDESEMRATVAAHLQSVLWLDEQIAALLDELESSGLNENTIVLFWSDNGFFLGERGVIGKSFPYRRAAEVAMSLSGPGIVPGESAALVQTLDAFPTLCELAGIEPPADLHGRSLLPLLRGEDSIRSTAYTELVGVVASIQSNELKLMLGAGGNTGWDLVYDLVNDPEERHALTAEQVDSNAVLELKGEMYRLLRASPPDGFPIDEWMTQEDETDAIRWALRQIDATR
ncbi:MAG: arylsulfatase A-like enzyme, partial [Planctomycetota bacterium]